MLACLSSCSRILVLLVYLADIKCFSSSVIGSFGLKLSCLDVWRACVWCSCGVCGAWSVSEGRDLRPDCQDLAYNCSCLCGGDIQLQLLARSRLNPNNTNTASRQNPNVIIKNGHCINNHQQNNGIRPHKPKFYFSESSSASAPYLCCRHEFSTCILASAFIRLCGVGTCLFFFCLVEEA